VNRQVFPSSLFPLRGDISAEAGATSVTVTGIQGIPVISPPVEPAGLNTFFYDSYNNDWFYASPWDIPVGIPLVWEGYGYGSSGISWIAPDTLAFGNGTDGDVSGAAAMTALVLFGSQSYYGPYNDYDVDYGPSYDQFYTSIFSGATQNWNLILPPNPGTSGQVLTTNGTGVTYWSTVSGGGGSVTSFSSGNLSPLFTTSVATPTTTPALSFSLNTQNANTVFAGPTSGGAATPTFRSLVAADLPAGTGTVTSVGLATGSGASDALYTISGSPVTTSGTLVETLNTQAKNTFLGGPISGANATPTFRGLNSADIPVPGSTGDVLYNNGGVLGAALTTITAAGSITLPDTQVIQWTGSAYSGVGLSQLAADTLAVGNGTESDVSGGMAMTALVLFGSASYYGPYHDYDVDYGPSYDQFYTSIFSGATQNWNLVLPETAGVNGQVLVNIGSGVTSWESLTTLGVPWSALTNPTANLSLTMGTDTTTFNYATGLAAAWTWQNNTPTVTGASTTVALSTSTAPTHVGSVYTYTLAASESGAGSNAWVGASVTTSGWTSGATGNNGTFTITASTTTTVSWTNASGTATNTGTPVMISSAVSSSPVIQIAGTVNTGTAGTLNSAADVWSIQNVIGSVVPNPTSALTFTHSGSSGTATVSVPNLALVGNIYYSSELVLFSGTPASNVLEFVAQGAQFRGSNLTTIGFSPGVPNQAAADTAISRVSAGILGIGTGAQGSIVGSIQCSSIALNGAVASPTAGVYYSGGTAGVSAGPFSAITSIQTVGGIVTVLADVSDERLKSFSEYEGGLAEVLAITPIKYTWNTEGQNITGFSEGRVFVGFRAQDVQKAIPEAVTQSASNAEYLGLDDRPVIAALVNAVKTLEARIRELEK